MAINGASRRADEWFDEPDDLERLQRTLLSLRDIEDVIDAAGAVASRVARAQAFGEGNKRTAFLLARWTLDQNGVDGRRLLPPEDRVVADLLVRAASGLDVEGELVAVLRSRLG